MKLEMRMYIRLISEERKLKIESGKLKVENGKWKMESGELKVEICGKAVPSGKVESVCAD